ncbi:MAG: Gfo/Idh/MocA family oxidoreductase [Planctomycetota bacterium]
MDSNFNRQFATDMNSDSKKNFALIGAAGYIAPKHMKAIKETGNRLVAAMDKHDSVGIIDSYFPNASFFSEVERFDRHLEKLHRSNDPESVDFVSICSPNYLHDAHCRLALRLGAHAICEKPLVINPWNIDQLKDVENTFGKKVYSILQLRLHPAVQALREKAKTSDEKAKVCLTYITRRGKWYQYSWKGDLEKSGGVTMNIGVHFFDFLIWVYGPVQSVQIHVQESKRASGILHLERANVKWFLSVDASDLPQSVVDAGGYAYRSIETDGQELDLSAGFTDLHTRVYDDILSGGGYGIEDAKPAIDLIYQIRNSVPVAPRSDAHPKVLSN